MRIPVQEILPFCTGLCYPGYLFENPSIIGSGKLTIPADRVLWREGFDLLPLFICQIHYAFTDQTRLRGNKYIKSNRKTNP